MLASSSSPNMETGPMADTRGEMSMCWEVDALGLMIMTPISTVETRPSSPGFLLVASSGPKG